MLQKLFTFTLLATLALTGCSRDDQPVVTLRMGVLPVLDTLPLQVALQEGLFQEQGLDVDLVNFASAHERDVAMQSGELDGYFGDMLISLLMIQGGVDMRVATIAYSTTPGQRMFGLVTAPDRGPESGMSVGISESTVIEYLLDRMQEQEGIRELDLDRVEVRKIPIRLQMLLQGQLDAAVLPEPLLSLAEDRGGRILATDEPLDTPLTVICLSRPMQGVAKDFLHAYGEAVRRINDDPEAYRGLMTTSIHIPEEMVPTFPVYRYAKPRAPSEQEVWRMQQWMLTQGLLDRLIPYEKIVF